MFAPAAAHLCAGVPLADLGRPIDPLSLLPGLLPLTREEDGALVAEVLWVDRYGNCQLNVDPDEVAAFGPRVQLRWGDDVRTAERVAHLRGHRARAGRPGRRQLRDAVGLPRQALGRRRAPPRRRHRGHPVAPVRRRRARRAPVTLTTKARTMRPGTTLVLAILLALILGAAALQLFFML